MIRGDKLPKMKNRLICFITANSYVIGIALATVAAAYIAVGSDVL